MLQVSNLHLVLALKAYKVGHALNKAVSDMAEESDNGERLDDGGAAGGSGSYFQCT